MFLTSKLTNLVSPGCNLFQGSGLEKHCPRFDLEYLGIMFQSTVYYSLVSFALKERLRRPKSAPAVPIVKALVNILLFIVINSHLPSLEIAIVHRRCTYI